ncbi:hypothetical protein D3C78_1686990 [compost metagenome]
MAKTAKPFYFVGIALLTMGAAFAAVGASGQAAFGYASLGLLAPGAGLLLAGVLSGRRRA